jgi:hypothetical protein
VKRESPALVGVRSIWWMAGFDARWEPGLVRQILALASLTLLKKLMLYPGRIAHFRLLLLDCLCLSDISARFMPSRMYPTSFLTSFWSGGLMRPTVPSLLVMGKLSSLERFSSRAAAVANTKNSPPTIVAKRISKNRQTIVAASGGGCRLCKASGLGRGA